MKKQIFALLILLFLISIIAAIGCEEYIREYFPRFDGKLYSSAAIFLFGLSYSLMVRNIIVFFIATATSIATPWIAEWFRSYWPFVVFIMTH